MRTRSFTRFALVAGFLVAQAAVAASVIGRPVPIAEGDRCFRCQRVLSDRWVAAETIAASTGQAYKFRTIRCLLTYQRDTRQPVSQVFVADDQTGAFIDAERAVFVPVTIDRHTGIMGYGVGETDYVAFKSVRAAEKFAASTGVTTMTWPAVVYYEQFLPTRHEAE